MNYFPMFLDIRGKDVLICGGGKHALEKVYRLKSFEANIRVISPKVTGEMEELDRLSEVALERRRFREEDLNSFPAFVIAAEDRAENERIVSLCRAGHIPVNAVDMQDICDFIFPAMIVSRQLCVGISTGGASPAAAVELKRRINGDIPEDIDEILLWMGEIRGTVREKVPDRTVQKSIFRQIVQRAFSEERILTEAELGELLDRAGDL